MNPTNRTIIAAVFILTIPLAALAQSGNASTFWAGLEHTPLGSAALIISPDDHLIVSNIGSSGLDGVSIDLGETAEGFLTQQPIDPIMPPGSWMRSDYYGEVNGVADQPAGSLGMEWVAGSIVALVDFTPLGSPTYTVELRDAGGNVLTVQSGLGDSEVSIRPFSGDDVVCENRWTGLDTGWTWTWPTASVEVSFGTGDVFIANGILFLPDLPPVGSVQVNRIDVLAAGMPSFETLGDKILVYETYHQAEGEAHLDASGGQLTVSNIGSSGLDGVSADLGETTSSCVIWEFQDGQVPAPGASFRYDALGNLGGVPDQVFSSLVFDYVGGSIQVSADSTPLGSSTHRVQVFDDQILLADLTGQTGPLVSMADSSKVSGLDIVVLSNKASSYGYGEGKYSADCAMSLGDGSVVVGNKFRIYPEAHIAAPTSISGYALTAQDTPPLVITAVLSGVVVPPNSVYWNSLEFTSRGLATLALTPEDHLLVANIGSSGLDGVSVDLPAGTLSECVIMEADRSEPGSFSIELLGTVDGVVRSIGSTTYAENPEGKIEVTADFSPIGSSTQLVQIWDGLTLVAEFPGQSGGLVQMIPARSGFESYVRQGPQVFQVGLEAKVFSVEPIMAGPLGEVFFGDRLVVLPEGATSQVDDLQGIVILCQGIDSVDISDVILNVPVSAAGETDFPMAVTLGQNMPNPFNPSTLISFDLPRRGRAKLDIFDVRGSLVRTLVSGVVEAGRHQRVWQGKDDGGREVSSGVYFYRLETEQGQLTRRMTLVK